MLWTDLPNEIHPRAGSMLLDFVLHQTVPTKEEGTLVGFNLAGYAANQVGLGQRVMATPEPSDEDCRAAAQALADACEPNAADGSATTKALPLPWGTILQLALKLLQAVLCLVLMLLVVGVAGAADLGSPVPRLRIAAARQVRGPGCQCGPDCPCANCPGNCFVETRTAAPAAQPATYSAPVVQSYAPVCQSYAPQTFIAPVAQGCSGGNCGVLQRAGIFRNRR